MNTEQTIAMAPMIDAELRRIDGGLVTLTSRLYDACRNLMSDIETHPERYTWTMDWYYSR